MGIPATPVHHPRRQATAAVQDDAVQATAPAVRDNHLRTVGRLAHQTPEPGRGAPIGGGTVAGSPHGCEQGLFGGAGRAREPVHARPRDVETTGGEMAVEAASRHHLQRLTPADEAVLVLGDGEYRCERVVGHGPSLAAVRWGEARLRDYLFRFFQPEVTVWGPRRAAHVHSHAPDTDELARGPVPA